MSLPSLAGKSLTLSLGVRLQKTLAALFPESDGLSFGSWCKRGKHQQVIGWGHKPRTEKAKQLADELGLAYLALEDGFYRSLRPGVLGEAPLSLVLDDLGIYYDASRSSRLEILLQEGGWQTPELLQRAETLIKIIRRHQISKYNHTRPLSHELPGKHSAKVLIVDQTYGDSSVTLGSANQATFKQMLDDAVAENPAADIIIKTHPDVIAGKKQGYFSTQDICSERVHLLGDAINPISLLEQVDRVYVVSSQLGFEALLCDKPVKCYGLPFYSGWGLTEDLQQNPRRTAKRSRAELFAAACILYPRYLNPDTGQLGEIEDLIDYFIRYKKLRDKLPGAEVVCGNFFWWKKRYLRRLLAPLGQRLSFTDSVDSGLKVDAGIVWGGRQKSAVTEYADQNNIPLISMEDGFIRSVGLGSDFALPLSLVLDKSGIYFDPQRPSDLEELLEKGGWSVEMLARAEDLRCMLLDGQISKYSVGNEQPLQLNATIGQRVILVPGQVEDDASIQLGCIDIKSNLGLLQEVKACCPDAYIVYKPHPDVVSGNRIGMIREDDALVYCHQVVSDLSMPACLSACDEVHTLTSLTGFEALLHGKQVATYGLPFYAGWGLTRDRHQCSRRTRKLSLEELIVGTLIEYPFYIDPQNKRLISVERAVALLRQQKLLRPAKISSRRAQKLLRAVRGLLQWNLC